MQSSRRVEFHRCKYPVGDDGIHTGTFIHLVEVGQWFPGKEVFSILTRNRRPLRVIQQSFHQVRSRNAVLQALLILNPDCIATEPLRKTQNCHIHHALLQDLCVSQFCSFIGAGDECHSARIQPAPYGLGLFYWDLLHSSDERRLAQALLIDAYLIEQVVFYDGVVHSHAAFIENAKNRFAVLEFVGQRFAKFGLRLGQRREVQLAHVAFIVRHLLFFQPLADFAPEALIRKVFGPNRAEADSRFMQTGIKVQHSHKAWPLARQVRHSQNRTAMAHQARKNVVAILPYGFGDHNAGLWVDAHKHIHAHTLAGNEPVVPRGIVGMPSANLDSLCLKGRNQSSFHLGLCGPAHLICRFA